MKADISDRLKQEVRGFWNVQSCDTQVAHSAKFTKDYFEEIETFRYQDQPFIHSFAQFTRYQGKRVLEVGFGAGTDFIQWLRAGALASGIDLTEEALQNVKRRLEVYGLMPAADLRLGDAENLPFESNLFDIGYSFGVLHHTPDTKKALAELVRVIRPGGELKVMLYNRRCIFIFNQWIRNCLLHGQPWHSLRWVMWNKLESLGTKGYSRRELLELFDGLLLRNIRISTEVTSADHLSASAFPPLNRLYRTALWLVSTRYRWDLSQLVPRANAPGVAPIATRRSADAARPTFTGNPLGHYHCISAVKTE